MEKDESRERENTKEIRKRKGKEGIESNDRNN